MSVLLYELRAKITPGACMMQSMSDHFKKSYDHSIAGFSSLLTLFSRSVGYANRTRKGAPRIRYEPAIASANPSAFIPTLSETHSSNGRGPASIPLTLA